MDVRTDGVDPETRTTEPDVRRLATFLGALVLLGGILIIASRFTDMSMVALAPVYMFTPLLAGLAVCLVYGIRFRAVGVRLGRPRWQAVSAIAALPLVGLTIAFAVAVPDVGFDATADPLPGMALPSGVAGLAAGIALVLGIGVTINAVFAFGEEFGWRGYLLWELAPLGFWKASVVIGALWGVWHAPVILDGYNYPSFPLVGVVAMTVACISFSPVYTYLVLRAESVFAAALLHGVFNAAAGAVLVFTVADEPILAELVASPVGLAGVAAFGLAAAAIAVAGAPTLDRSFAM